MKYLSNWWLIAALALGMSFTPSAAGQTEDAEKQEVAGEVASETDENRQQAVVSADEEQGEMVEGDAPVRCPECEYGQGEMVEDDEQPPVPVTEEVYGVEEVGDVADARLEEYRQATGEFAESLKQALREGMEAGGAVAAVGICHSKAALISRQYAAQLGWHLGRTSLKPRNPDNVPDAWEKEVMEKFQQRLEAGAKAEDLEFAKILEQNGEYKIRYMRAIPTGEVCQTCHGSELAPEVAARIQELYPHDQAVGFQPGDLRGAFTLTQDLSAPCVTR